MPRSLVTRGKWPGLVVLRSGWSLAQARPWNDDLEGATLRVDRGNTPFLKSCTQWLLLEGAPAVTSVPLHRSARGMWEDAGFKVFRQLKLMERDLSARCGQVVHPVRVGSKADLEDIFQIDQESFEVEWRIGHLGLKDAMEATPRSRILMLDDPDPVGFSVLGIAGSVAYLQRLAVLPDKRGLGYGRSLVRSGILWARERGAYTMILNTQTDNETSTALYQSEGFELLPDHLHLVRYSRHR